MKNFTTKEDNSTENFDEHYDETYDENSLIVGRRRSHSFFIEDKKDSGLAYSTNTEINIRISEYMKKKPKKFMPSLATIFENEEMINFDDNDVNGKYENYDTAPHFFE